MIRYTIRICRVLVVFLHGIIYVWIVMTGLIKVTGGKREALQHVARAPVVVLVFSMDGCGPCKALKQRLKTLEGTFDDVMYVECNVDDSDDNYAFAESEDVTGYPTVDIYENGTRVGKDVDFQNIEDVIRDAAAPYQSPMKTPQKSGGSASGRTCHAFVGYKGGSGKSTLLFQTASQYAKENPQDNVLVIDSSFSGDLSHLSCGNMGNYPQTSLLVSSLKPCTRTKSLQDISLNSY
jgi:thiol-disulfide isomerase/thioredoxin